MSMELVLLVGFIALVIGLSVGFFLKGKKVPSAVEPSPDLEEKRKEANEIILKAKQEAQEILKKAQEEAREIKLVAERDAEKIVRLAQEEADRLRIVSCLTLISFRSSPSTLGRTRAFPSLRTQEKRGVISGSPL